MSLFRLNVCVCEAARTRRRARGESRGGRAALAGARREVTSGGAGPGCVCVRGAGGAAQAAPRQRPNPEPPTRPDPTRRTRHGLAAQGGPGGEAQGATRPAGSGRGAVAARPLVVRPPARSVSPAPHAGAAAARVGPGLLPGGRRVLLGPSRRCSVPGSPRLPSPAGARGGGRAPRRLWGRSCPWGAPGLGREPSVQSSALLSPGSELFPLPSAG